MHKGYIRPFQEQTFMKVFQGITAVDVDCGRRQVAIRTEQGCRSLRIVVLKGFVYFESLRSDLIRRNGVCGLVASGEKRSERHHEEQC